MRLAQGSRLRESVPPRAWFSVLHAAFLRDSACPFPGSLHLYQLNNLGVRKCVCFSGFDKARANMLLWVELHVWPPLNHLLLSFTVLAGF